MSEINQFSVNKHSYYDNNRDQRLVLAPRVIIDEDR